MTSLTYTLSSLSEKLLPCPFCGSANVALGHDTVDGTYEIVCLGCAASLPAGDVTKEGAITQWIARSARLRVSDELDAATVERCAQVADAHETTSHFGIVAKRAIALRIRSLIPNSANEIHSSDDPSKPTCELCGARAHDPCQTKEQQAKCELPSFCFPKQDCAPAGTVSELNSQYAGLEALLAAIHANDPKRELLVRVGDLMRENRALLSQFDVRRK